MTPKQQWKTLNFNGNQDAIKSILDSIVDANPNTPANNRWEYLFPLISLFPHKTKVVFYTLFSENSPVLCLPIVLSKQSKFFISWYEIGFPFHKHINLISINSALTYDVLLSLTKRISQDGFKWSRFSIRHILSYKDFNHTNIEHYVGDVAWFSTLNDLTTADIVSKKHLRNIRRLEKKVIPDSGEISFTCNQNGLDTALHTFSELELNGWKGHSGVAINSCKKLSSMYKKIVENFGLDTVKFFNIHTNDHLLASALGFELGNTLYIHKVSFNPEYSIFSPGNILLLKILESSIESETISIVNLVTYPSWAKRWHPDKAYTHDIIIYNDTLKGQLLNFLIASWRRMKPFIKQGLKRI
jgi:hypothetical protein